MAYDFTLQTKLQAPTPANVRKVNADIRRSFLGLSVNYNDKGAKKAIVDMKKIGRAADDAGKKVKNFGDKLGTQGTSYLSYALVSGAIIRLTSAFAGATNEAIRFEKELIKIAQVTRQSNGFILKNARIITDISREYGLATNKVAELTRLLAQTGLSFKQAADGARTLAKTELLASFDNLSDTTEGLIALMNSFNLSTVDAAKGLEAINAVSKRFAVESGDIVEAIKRTGGAFSAAGGDINELIALFTSVRATSRESGETIATAFRTIFGRLQRPKTIDYFKELNIELADANGNFVGGYAAIERISRGLNELGIRAGSIKFAEIAEQVGGIRQLSKVIPLLTKFSDAQEALAVANAAEAESEDDVAKARKSLSFQIAQLTSEFRALIFEITQTAGFKIVATLFIETARAAIDLTRALKPLLPLFAAIGAFKGFRVASSVFNKIQGSKQQAQGFNRGGPVPGSGNGDTVPAMLEPGEFVIRKSAVQAYGTQNLANINKYARGGKSKKTNGGKQLGSAIRDQSLSKFYDINNSGVYDYQNVKLTRGKTPRSRDYYRGRAEEIWSQASVMNISDGNALILKATDGFSQKLGSSELKSSNTANQRLNKITGGLAEQDVFKSRSRLTKLKDSRGPDFLAPGGKYIEVKTNKGSVSDNILLKKALLGTGQSKRGPFRNKRKDLVSPNLEFLQAFNKGGAVGTDTVPSLLTPGEFVINRKSAQAFGYGKLGEINKYAKGGPVQKFASGGLSIPTRADGTADVKFIKDNTQSLKDNTKEVREAAKQDKAERQKAGQFYKTTQKIPSPLDIQSAANRKKGLNKTDFLSAERSKSAGPDLISGLSESSKKQRVEFQKQAKAQSNLRKETNKLQKGFSLSGTSVLTFGLGMSAVGGILESFGLEMNSVSAAQKKNSILLFTTAAALISYQKQIRGLGRSLKAGKLQGFAQKLGPKFGGFVAKLGGGIQKLGSTVAKNAGKLVKGLGALAAIDIAGSVASALVVGDASKTRDAAIKSGSVDEAGAAAVKAFGQELNNSIPIIGGWLNILAPTFLSWASGLNGAVKAGAELEATFVKNDKVFSESFKQLSKSIATGNITSTNEQIKLISSATSDERSRAQNLQGINQGVQDNLFFGNWLGGATATIKANSETAIKGFERSSEKVSSAVSQTSPFIDSYAAKLIIAGKTSEEVADIINAKFSTAIKGLGLVRSPEDIKKAEYELLKTREKLQQANAKKVAQADDFWSNARKKNINDVSIAALEAKEREQKAIIEAGKASQAAELAAKALREEQLILNAAYRDAAKSLRLLTAELSALDGKIANADLAKELTSTPFGATSGAGALRKRFGTDELSGSLKDISARDARTGGGQLAQLRRQATTFVGQEAGKQVQQGILLQRAADAVSQDITTNGKSLSTALEDAQNNFINIDKENQSGVIDQQSANRQKREVTKDFLKDNVFGGSIPAELEGQIDGIVVEFSKALESGNVSAEQLSQIFENGGTKLSAQAIKGIQTQLDQQAKRSAELGRLNAKLFELKRQQTQAEYEQERKAAQALNQIASDRISSLSSAGASDESLRGARRRNIAKSRGDNLSKIGLTTAGARDVLSPNIRNRLKQQTQAVGGKDPTGQIAQDGSVVTDTIRSEAKLEDQRQRSIQSLKNINAALDKDNELRKQGLSLQIEEANARRTQIQALNDAVGNIVTEFAFGSDKQRTDLAESAAITRSALSQGGLQGLTGDQRGAVGSFLDRFSGAGKLDIFGGKDAATVKGEFAAKEAVQAGLIKPSEFQKFADAAAKKAVPVEDRIQEKINATYSEIEKNQNAINANEKAIVETQGAAIKTFEASVAEFATATRAFFERSGNNQQRAVQMDRAEEVRNEQARRMRLLPSQLSNTSGDQQGGSQDANVQLSPVKVDVGGPWIKAIEGLAKDVVTKGVLQAVGLKLLEVAQNTDGSTTPQDLARTNAEMFQNGVGLVQ